MITVKVDKMIVHAYHGIYDGEPLVGGDFEVNIDVDYDEGDSLFDQLGNTISYVALIDIATARMNTPTQLLEKVALHIADDIRQAYPQAKASRISIYKLQAPITRFQGRVGIVLSRIY